MRKATITDISEPCYLIVTADDLCITDHTNTEITDKLHELNIKLVEFSYLKKSTSL